MKFEEVSEEEWNLISPYLPAPAPTGRPRADDRRTINGIRYVLITGCKWADMPRVYGSAVTAWRRLKSWEERGVWSRIMQQLKNEVYKAVKISIDVVSIDSKTIMAKKGAIASATTAIRERKAQRFMQRSAKKVYR
jgi:transposase